MDTNELEQRALAAEIAQMLYDKNFITKRDLDNVIDEIETVLNEEG